MPVLQANNLASGFAPTPGARFPWRAMSVGATLLGLMALLYLGMEFGYKPYLESNLLDLQDKQKKADAQITSAQEDDLLLFYSQLTNLEKLLSNHSRPSALLDLFERNTLPKVRYSQATLRVADRKLQVMGSAIDYMTVAQQAYVFSQAKEIQLVTLKKAQIEKSLVNFDFELTLDPMLLRYSSNQ